MENNRILEKKGKGKQVERQTKLAYIAGRIFKFLKRKERKNQLKIKQFLSSSLTKKSYGWNELPNSPNEFLT